MITILISMAMLAQSDSLASGARMRAEANKMIMGMQNVPYDVADVLNGSSYTVEQATEIAAQRRRMRAAEEQRQRQAEIKDIQSKLKQIVKNWAEMEKAYDLIITGKVVCPADQLEVTRGRLRRTLDTTALIAERRDFPRNVRTAAKAHLKKGEAALAVLEKQNPGK